MKTAVKWILLFACLFALAQWASHLDLSFFWGAPAHAQERPSPDAARDRATPTSVSDWLESHLAAYAGDDGGGKS